jgi:nucleotide-binding universal stress UspA family protein
MADTRPLRVGKLLTWERESGDMKVLLGTGGREDGFDALDRTLERTREAGDDLTVAVLETSSDEDVESVAADVREQVAATGIDAEVRVLEGHPGSQLVELAETEGFERIVLGGGQRSPLGKIDLGEVAEFVLLNADVSVTLVR